MNTYDLINEFYAGIDDEEIFQYTNNIVKIYTNEDSEIFEEESIVKYKYEGNEYFFTTGFVKVKFSIEQNKYYAVETKLPYPVDFTFPKKSIHSIYLQPKLNLEYDEIHDLILRQAINIAVQYIQTNYINYCYDEIELLKKKFKEFTKISDHMQVEVIKLKDENEMLKKRLTMIERKMSPSGLETFVNKNQKVI